jgi:hypothetical protein
MSEPIPIEALQRVADALRQLGVEYYIGGSIASVVHGIPRSTVDIDLVAEIRREHARPLAQALGEDFYAEEQMIRDAIARGGSFNLIHLPTMYKVDVFVARGRPFDRSARGRAAEHCPVPGDPRRFPVASAEDVILSKLEWYRAGGEISERQWTDVIGVMKIQSNHLDWDYLRRWAAELEVADLLDRARREAAP